MGVNDVFSHGYQKTQWRTWTEELDVELTEPVYLHDFPVPVPVTPQPKEIHPVEENPSGVQLTKPTGVYDAPFPWTPLPQA